MISLYTQSIVVAGINIPTNRIAGYEESRSWKHLNTHTIQEAVNAEIIWEDFVGFYRSSDTDTRAPRELRERLAKMRR